MEELELHGKALGSRIVFPAMATASCRDGLPGEGTALHYRAVASNPLVGMMVTEHTYVSAQGKADPHQMSFATDDVVPAQRRLVSAIREESPSLLALAQINHAGAATMSSVTGEQPVSASAMSMTGEEARALRADELPGIAEAFARAAVRVREAGWDGVEVHAAHGFLLSQFYSPLSNVRTDGYGPGSVESRMRLSCEVLRAVREAVGDDFIVAVRFGGADFMDGGATMEDAAIAAPLLEAAGADLIDVSGGMHGFSRPRHREPGYFQDLSRAIRDVVSVPVMVTGGVRTPEQAQQIIDAGNADLVGVGRALLRSPKTWGTQRR